MNVRDEMVDIDLEDESIGLTKDASETGYDTFDVGEENDSPTRWAYLPQTPSILESINQYLPSWQSIKYYLPSFKNTLIVLGSLISTLPLLPFAFGFPTGTAPRYFSSDWFLELSVFYMTASILNTIVFLGIETLIRYDHFSGMLSRLTDIFKNSSQSILGIISLISIAFFSGTAAIAGGGLGYASFAWYPPIAPISAILNGSVVLGFRMEFMASFYHHIQKQFNSDTEFQVTIIHLLEKLKVEYASEFSELSLEDEINEETAGNFLHALFSRALEEEKESESIFHAAPCYEKANHYLGQGVDLLNAGIFGTAFGTFFALNGYVGLEILCSLMATQCPINALSHNEQVIIAVITGLSSGVLGYMTGLDLRHLVQNTYEHIKKYPHDIVKLLAILLACGVQASSIVVACNDIQARDNVFGLTEGLLGTLFTAATTCLIAGFCYKSLYELLLRKEDVPLNVENVASWLEHHELTPEAIASLREHSFFNRNKANDETSAPELNLTLARV